MFPVVLSLIAAVLPAAATPYQGLLSLPKKSGNDRFFDIQSHRGARGIAIENTLPSFAWGLIEGATTLEFDNGVTQDGVVIVWHDEAILPSKCRDTDPVFPNDPAYPYVGKFIANLTLAQVKTLDCSKRQADFPLQLVYPGTRISTLQEILDFLDCADPHHHILLNIESKINPIQPNCTHDVKTFVQKQHEVFFHSHYYHSITYESFDWRTLIEMKRLDPSIRTSALVDDTTAYIAEVSPWLGGVDLTQFDGITLEERIAQAAHYINADILSPMATVTFGPDSDSVWEDNIGFINAEMVNRAHELGLSVKPWTVNRLNLVEQLVALGVDGIITDCKCFLQYTNRSIDVSALDPEVVRRWSQQQKVPVAPRYPKYQVLACHSRRDLKLSKDINVHLFTRYPSQVPAALKYSDPFNKSESCIVCTLSRYLLTTSNTLQ